MLGLFSLLWPILALATDQRVFDLDNPEILRMWYSILSMGPL
jgi:hypothetical protein